MIWKSAFLWDATFHPFSGARLHILYYRLRTTFLLCKCQIPLFLLCKYDIFFSFFNLSQEILLMYFFFILHISFLRFSRKFRNTENLGLYYRPCRLATMSWQSIKSIFVCVCEKGCFKCYNIPFNDSSMYRNMSRPASQASEIQKMRNNSTMQSSESARDTRGMYRKKIIISSVNFRL